MIVKADTLNRGIEIDLRGPQGNAYFLLGQANAWAKQLGLDSEEIQKDMMSSDYEHLVKVFDAHFGHFVTLIR